MIKFQWFFLLLAALLMVGCAGDNGGTGSSKSTKAIRGIASNISANSITVNSVTLDASSANVTVNGNAGSVTEINTGQVITVTAEMTDNHSGTAIDIEYDNELQGLVLAMDGASLNVMGQMVTTDDATIIQGVITVDSVVVDSVVEVSGYIALDGTIVASYIEVKNDTEIEVTGNVLDLVTNADGSGSFMLNKLTVNFSANALGNLILVEGDYVEVESDVSQVTNRTPESPAMNAISIELEDENHGMDGAEDAETEFSGIITSVAVDSSSFVIEGLTVFITDATRIYPGVVIKVGAIVDVSGVFDSNGNVIASEIEPEDIPGDGMSMPTTPSAGNSNGGSTIP